MRYFDVDEYMGGDEVSAYQISRIAGGIENQGNGIDVRTTHKFLESYR